MEMHHLKSFKTVAEEGNLSRAAERLHASQPTVSAHVKALEDELGLALFARTPRGMELTPAGTQLLVRARDVLAAAAELNRQAMHLREEIAGPVAIGLNTDAEYLRVDELLAAFAKNLPGVRLHLLQSSSGLILRDIHEGKLDAGFAFFDIPYADVAGVTARTSPIVLAAPSAWAERIQDAAIEDLAGLPWVLPAAHCPFRTFLEHIFRGCGLWPEQVIEADHEEIIRRLVSMNQGISLMREDEARACQADGLLAYRSLGEQYQVDLHFAFRRDREGEPLIRRLVQLVLQVHEAGDHG
jgi:DNA-binding transcriptional LysR family regulator